MRILLVLHEPPLPFASAGARWYHVLVRTLGERGHELTTFVGGASNQVAMEQTRSLFPAERFDIRFYPGSTGSRGLVGKFDTLRRPQAHLFGPELRADLAKELAAGFDVLHLDQLWSGWLGLDHAERSVLHIHFLNTIDLAEHPAGSPADMLMRSSLQAAERRLLPRYPWITTLTPRLTEATRRLSPRSEVRTIPLAMDLSLYPFEPEDAPRDGGPVLGLIGSFHWVPSFSAGRRLLEKLWPEIKRRVPSARLQIVGRQAKKALGGYVSEPDVSIFENVPETLPYFRSTDVMLYAPSRGSGMKVKVLEAFALGTPVVTTTEGVEGLPAKDQVHAGVVDGDEGLIERAVDLLESHEKRCQQRLAARILVEEVCDPDAAIDRFEDVYRSITERSTTRV